MATRNMAQVGRETAAMSVDEAIVAANLPPRMVERLEAEADALYTRLHAQDERWARMMGSPRSLTPQETSQEAMRTHYLYCAALGALNCANVVAERYLGKTPAEIAEDVVGRAAARRRGAGARAVARTYGPNAARTITGHTIQQ